MSGIAMDGGGDKGIGQGVLGYEGVKNEDEVEEDWRYCDLCG